MGNYCCGENNDNQSPSLRKLSLVERNSSPSKSANSSPTKIQVQKELLKVLNKNEEVKISDICPQIKDIEVVGELGKGGQAEILQVVVETNSSIPEDSAASKKDDAYALKFIQKPKSSYRASSLALGSQLMLQNKCPFLVEGLFCCQSEEYLFSVMQIAEGGDLSSFLEKTIGKGDAFRRLGQQGIRMVLAGIVLGLQYIHEHGFIYCDLKIENVLIGRDGYPRLADFDLACCEPRIPSDKYQTTMTSVGPEIFLDDHVDKGMDLWALGVLIFTLLYGETPYSKQDIEDGSFVEQCKKKENKYGLKRQRASQQILDLINSLLKFKASDRLGYNSISEIRKHSFFKDLNWGKYYKKQIYNPIAEIVALYRKRTKKFRVKKTQSCGLQAFSPVKKKGSMMSKNKERRTKCDLEASQSLQN